MIGLPQRALSSRRAEVPALFACGLWAYPSPQLMATKAAAEAHASSQHATCLRWVADLGDACRASRCS